MVIGPAVMRQRWFMLRLNTRNMWVAGFFLQLTCPAMLYLAVEL